MLAASPRDRGPSAPSLRIVTSVSVVMPRPLSTQISCALYWSASPDTPLNKTGFPSSLRTWAAITSNVLPWWPRAVRTCPASIDTVIVSEGGTVRCIFARDRLSRSRPAPTLMVRRQIVSCHGRSSPIGKNSDRNCRARRYGNQAPSFANVRSYSGVHRSGMSSDAGASVDRSVIAHRQGLNRGAATSTVPNNEFNCRERASFSERRLWQCEQRRRSALYSATRASTRCRCTPANRALPSSSVRASGSRGEWGSLPLPRTTSCIRFVPSAPLSSIVTRHSILAPRSVFQAPKLAPPGLGRSHATEKYRSFVEAEWSVCGSRTVGTH